MLERFSKLLICTTVDADYSPVAPVLVLESVLVSSPLTETDVAVPENVPLTGEELNVVAVETVELDVSLAGSTVLVDLVTKVVKLEVAAAGVVVVVDVIVAGAVVIYEHAFQ